MTGLVRSTVSPSSSSMSRSTPWVDGCWGPMLMIMVSSSDRSTSMSDGIDGHALGQPQHGPDLAAQLAGRRRRAPAELLAALRRLAEEARVLLGPVRVEEPDAGGAGRRPGPARDRRPARAVAGRPGLLLVVHRGPGASLNWTGTRPTP